MLVTQLTQNISAITQIIVFVQVFFSSATFCVNLLPYSSITWDPQKTAHGIWAVPHLHLAFANNWPVAQPHLLPLGAFRGAITGTITGGSVFETLSFSHPYFIGASLWGYLSNDTIQILGNAPASYLALMFMMLEGWMQSLSSLTSCQSTTHISLKT